MIVLLYLIFSAFISMAIVDHFSGMETKSLRIVQEKGLIAAMDYICRNWLLSIIHIFLAGIICFMVFVLMINVFYN